MELKITNRQLEIYNMLKHFEKVMNHIPIEFKIDGEKHPDCKCVYLLKHPINEGQPLYLWASNLENTYDVKHYDLGYLLESVGEHNILEIKHYLDNFEDYIDILGTVLYHELHAKQGTLRKDTVKLNA